MFRLSEQTVIDATMTGNLARYLNHCCSPNCMTECIEIEREKKIVIITNRRVEKGEEVLPSLPSSLLHLPLLLLYLLHTVLFTHLIHTCFLCFSAHVRLQVRLRGRQQDPVQLRGAQLQEVDELSRSAIFALHLLSTPFASLFLPYFFFIKFIWTVRKIHEYSVDDS